MWIQLGRDLCGVLFAIVSFVDRVAKEKLHEMTIPEPAEQLTIPVVVDDVARDANGRETPSPLGNSLVRCVYFSIDASEPSPGWTLGILGRRMPFFMLGLSGIIYTPVTANGFGINEFDSYEDIESTFDAIEQSRNLLIESARVYLPSWFIKAAMSNTELKVQSVFRVRQDVFTAAFEYSNGKINEKTFFTALGGLERQFFDKSSFGTLPIRYSPEETNSFRIWSEIQMEEARNQFSNWQKTGEVHPEIKKRKRKF